MQFLVKDIIAAGMLEFNDHCEPAVLFETPSSDVSFLHPVNAAGHAQLATGDIYVSARVQTVLTFRCARCLELFERPFESRFTQTFNADSVEIDLTQDVRETVLLELPIKALCQPDCEGLCLQCGKNKNLKECQCPEGNSRGPLGELLKIFPSGSM